VNIIISPSDIKLGKILGVLKGINKVRDERLPVGGSNSFWSCHLVCDNPELVAVFHLSFEQKRKERPSVN
jgi:hypothetical protein